MTAALPVLALLSTRAAAQYYVIEAEVADATAAVAELEVIEVLWGDELELDVVTVESAYRSHTQGHPVTSEGRFAPGQRLILEVVEIREEDRELLDEWRPPPEAPFLVLGEAYVVVTDWAVDSYQPRKYHPRADKSWWNAPHLLVGRCPHEVEDVRAALRKGETPPRLTPKELAEHLRRLRQDRRALRGLQPHQRERIPSRRKLRRYIEEQVLPSVGCGPPFSLR